MRLGKLIGLFLAAVLCIGIIPVNAFAAGGSGSSENFAEKTTWKDDLFRDVTDTDWFCDNVRAVYESGLMVGKGDGVFDPSGNVTVAEILTVAARLNAIYTTGSDDFEKTEPWYAGYAAYCLEQGIVTGLPDDMNAPAVRGFVAAVLAAAIPEEEFDAKNTVSDGAIPDVSLEDPFGPAVLSALPCRDCDRKRRRRDIRTFFRCETL